METIKINVNGTIKDAQRILLDGSNYIKLRDVEDDLIKIDYVNNMPTVSVMKS